MKKPKRGWKIAIIFWLLGLLCVAGCIVCIIDGSFWAAIPLLAFGVSAFVYPCCENERERKEQIERERKEQIEQERKEQQRLDEEKRQKRKEQIEQYRQQQLNLIRNSGINEVDRMNGRQFEVFIHTVLTDYGFSVRLTKQSGDYGADLLVYGKNGYSAAVQLKRYSEKVSLNAVQEVIASKSIYGVSNAWVITNNFFTDSATTLARANKVLLIDRNGLMQIIVESRERRKKFGETKST